MKKALIPLALLLLLLCLISLNARDLRVRRIVSLLGPLPFVLGLISAITAAPIYRAVYFYLPAFSPAVIAGNLFGTFFNTLYFLFTGLWLLFHVKATVAGIKSREGTRVPAEGYVKQTVVSPDGSTAEEWVPQDPAAFPHMPRRAAPPAPSQRPPQSAESVQEVPAQVAPGAPAAPESAPAAFTPPTPQPGEPPLVVTNEMLGKLKMLQDLKQDGVIDEAEFQARRQKIFNVEK